MKGVLVVAVLAAAFMATIKDGRVPHKLGLTGGCTAVATPQGQSGAWERCVPGKLEGAPDLSRQGCVPTGTYRKAEFWRCPEELDSGPHA